MKGHEGNERKIMQNERSMHADGRKMKGNACTLE